MTEFWESSFRDKQEMWGWKPADSAIETVALFKKNSLNKILVRLSITVFALQYSY